MICQLLFAAFLAYVGRDLVPAAVYAFNDALVGWLCIFAFLALLVLTFHIGNETPPQKVPSDATLEAYEHEVQRLRSENEDLKLRIRDLQAKGRLG